MKEREGVVGSLAEFGGSIITLAELQARLTACELRACAHRATAPAIALAVAVAVVIGSLPVALTGLADWVAIWCDLTPATALLATGGGAIVVGAALAVAGVFGVRKSFGCVKRSREELSRNVAWVKAVIAQPRHMWARRTG